MQLLGIVTTLQVIRERHGCPISAIDNRFLMLFVPLVDIVRDFFPRHSRQACQGLPSFSFIGYLLLTVREQSGRELKLTIHVHLMLKLRISGAKLILSICPHGLHITHLCRLNFLILLFLISMNLPPGVPNSKPKVLSSLSALPEHLLSPMICVSFRNITLSYAEVLAYGLCPKFLISTNSRSAQSSAQIPLNMSLCRYLFVDFRTSVVLTALQVLLYLAAAT